MLDRGTGQDRDRAVGIQSQVEQRLGHRLDPSPGLTVVQQLPAASRRTLGQEDPVGRHTSAQFCR